MLDFLEFLIETFQTVLEVVAFLWGDEDPKYMSKGKKALTIVIAVLFSLLLMGWIVLAFLYLGFAIKGMSFGPSGLFIAWCVATVPLIGAVIGGIVIKRKRKKAVKPVDEAERAFRESLEKKQ